MLWVLIRINKAILMSTHNICFYGELSKIILQLSSNTLLICSTVRAWKWGALSIHFYRKNRTPEKFAVITLKCKQSGSAIEQCIHKMQTE